MTRIPVPIKHDSVRDKIVEPMPPPAVSLLSGRKLTEPDSKFIADLATAIRAGVRPLTAAQWLGVSRKLWKRWRQRTGGVYDELRDAQRAALAHLETKLQADLAKRSPGQALKGLRRIRDDEPESESRAYHQSGVYTLKKALPHLLERVNDSAIPDADLSPVENAARQWRESVISDLGGRDAMTTTKLALLNASVGTWIVLSSIDAYLFQMASADGLVSRKHRRVFPIVEQRMRVADTLARQLAALGLERVPQRVQTLDAYIASKYGGPTGDPTPADTAKEP
jgi:hypothetical protein